MCLLESAASQGVVYPWHEWKICSSVDTKVITTTATIWLGILARNFGLKYFFRLGILEFEIFAGHFGLKNAPKFNAQKIGLKWHFGGQNKSIKAVLGYGK